MRILKKKALWFSLYGVFITAVFIYLLFPGDILKSRLEAQVNSADFVFMAGSLKPSLPLGLTFGNISLGSAQPGDVIFQGETLDLQAGWQSLWQKLSYLNISGNAYSGSFNGRIGFVSVSKVYPPVEGFLNFQNIDIGKYSFLKNEIGRDVAGKLRGSLVFENNAGNYSKANGTIKLFLVKGSYPLAEPFLGLNRIEIERGEIQAQMKNGSLKIEKLEIFGPQINCSIKGDIILAPEFKNSQLNLTGTIEILSKSKMKTNITINGTLTNPVSRYI